ncbi:apolipoprotein N-acyltransferase [Promicromonospora sp. NPDC052451]|uniref:apolipoprotein N-acyltransferase n=1 Tax=Promicromonospora sp. NPDC052451 TaxID=3364407 RepID=UPI0037C6FE99
MTQAALSQPAPGAGPAPEARTTARTRPLDPPLLPLAAAVPVAALAGVTLDGAFPALGWWPLAFVAVTLALLTLVGRRAWGAVLAGAAFGAAFWFPHVSWSSRFLGDDPLGWVPWVALATAQTLFTAALSPLVTLAYRWLPRWRSTGVVRLVVLPLLVAGAWTTRELAMGSWPYGGFPWGRLGMSQSASPIAPVASWLGVSGLSFCMVLLCAAVIEVVRVASTTAPARVDDVPVPAGEDGAGAARRWRRWTAALPATLPTAVPAVVLAVLLLVTPQFPTSHAGTLRVGAVQGNGPAAYSDERAPGALLDAQLAASAPLADERVDLVVWPEGGVGSDPLADPATERALDTAARQYDAPLLVNAASSKGELIYNTSFLWTEEGATASHAKRHPVPFGEYVPDRWLYGAIVPSLVNLLGREYTPGTDVPAVDTGDAVVGLAICFDVVFDDVVREGIGNGAQAFMFQTNNADFRGTDENLQQTAFARMRAVETGRAVVNLSTTGTSQVFAPDGTAGPALPADQAGLIVTDVELRDGVTAGVALGPWVQGLVVAGTVLALAGLAVQARRSSRRKADTTV